MKRMMRGSGSLSMVACTFLIGAIHRELQKWTCLFGLGLQFNKFCYVVAFNVKRIGLQTLTLVSPNDIAQLGH